MKLLYFSGSTLPSSYANAVHVMKMCQAFAKDCGHDVSLFAKSGEAINDEELFKRYDVESCFKIVRAPAVKIRGLSGLARIAYTLLKRPEADLIYGRDFWTMGLMAGHKTPIAFELHEIPHTPLQRCTLRKILNAKNLKKLTVITEGLKKDLLDFAPTFDPAKILVAPDGADCPQSPIDPAPLQTIPNTSLQAGYAGSLYKGKGVELIIEIAKSAPHIGFHIFGGPENELQNWKNQKPPENIHFYGHIPHGMVKNQLAACDVLLAPYLPSIHIDTGADISRWISPLKLFEYMAIQKPIICSDLPVLREVIIHNENALLADPTKPKKWAQALETIEKNEKIAKKIATNSHNDLANKYSWSKRAQNINTALTCG